MNSRPDTVSILKTIVAYKTVSSESNLPLVDWLGDYLEDCGGRIRQTFNDEKTKANILASFGPEGDGGIVLSGHTDVVPVEGQAWSSDPFTLRVEDDRVYARGAVDMKGFVAGCLSMVTRAQQERLTRPLHVALSYDEEVGCIGVSRLVDDMIENVGRPQLAIIGEPTEMSVGHSHRGIVSCRTSFWGKAGHSSQPDLGVNAIYSAAKLVSFIEELGTGHQASGSPTTLNVGRVDGGVAMNVIPDACSVLWEARTARPDDAIGILETVGQYLKNSLGDPSTYQNDVLCSAPALRADQNGDALELFAKLGAKLPGRNLPFCTEAGFFQAAGLQTVVCGPGSIAQAHKPDEWISRAQLQAAEGMLGRIFAWCTSH